MCFFQSIDQKCLSEFHNVEFGTLAYIYIYIYLYKIYIYISILHCLYIKRFLMLGSLEWLFVSANFEASLWQVLLQTFRSRWKLLPHTPGQLEIPLILSFTIARDSACL